MAFAIVKTGGKQYKVQEGDVLNVEKLPVDDSGKIIFNEVLLIDDGKKTVVGKPFIEGATVEAELVEQGRAKKVVVIHYKAKVRFKKTYGHRQPFTKVKIGKVA
ncbi:MAG: 50S ribosomal protein L21 [bacterium]